MKKNLERIGKLFKNKSKEELDDEIEEEIISMVNEGHEHGVLLASEATMIQNIFEFGDKVAKDIMIHRKQMVCLDGDMSFSEALDFVKTSSFSRYPVFLHDLDHIIVVLNIKDALLYVRDDKALSKKLRDFDELLQPAAFVPETHNLNTLFAKMQSKKNHMMIVVDEYGQTSGLISMEDILEEIVGNILDEHDEEELSIEEISKDQFSMSGATELEEAAQVLGIEFPEEFETLNGFLISLLGRIPNEHESFTVNYDKYSFFVQDVEDRMIQQVQVSKI